jgi:hypothetical protein
MKIIKDLIKSTILKCAIIPHVFIVYHRMHYNKKDIFADRPIWVVKALATRITDEFFEEEDSQETVNAMYNITNSACVELRKRKLALDYTA